ncbi:hypothetical protein ACN27G_31380 [Plantactinospora sp. WMMB334]|uniref:hypothetical protein n=1 Tax=Plantactinospora sp. WMMB334 TaxID=3404119 RepID=UPI003B942082
MTGSAARRVRNRMALSARLIMIEHWPRANGLCPICKLSDCRALATARAYLEMVNDPFVPTRPDVDVIDIDSRAASSARATGTEPVDGGPLDGGG